MPIKRNKKGGKGYKRGKRGGGDDRRELIFAEDQQVYGKAVRMLGNGRLEAFCYDGVTRLAHIRGAMRKKVWVHAGDILLLALRDFQDDKCDVVHKYTFDEAHQLKAYRELPDHVRLDSIEAAGDEAAEDDGIDFHEI